MIEDAMIESSPPAPHPFSLTGRTALVTGASGGLGREIAKALGTAGAFVFVNGRNPETLVGAVTAIEAAGGGAAPLPFDVADETAATAAIVRAADVRGALDILVNTVGVRDRRALLQFDTQSARRVIELNLVAPFVLCREAARLMVPTGWGRIINVTSIHRDDLAGDVGRGLRGQEDRRTRDLAGMSPAFERGTLREPLGDGRIRHHVRICLGSEEAGRDGVDRDAVGS